MSEDINIVLIKKAIETKTEIILIPRRSHTVKGIPINFESNILRVWVNTGKSVESVLISEIGHFSFSVELWNLLDSKEKIKSNKVKIKNNGDSKENKDNFKEEYEGYVRTCKEGKEKLNYDEWLKTKGD
jgi:hypothetical protein